MYGNGISYCRVDGVCNIWCDKPQLLCNHPCNMQLPMIKQLLERDELGHNPTSCRVLLTPCPYADTGSNYQQQCNKDSPNQSNISSSIRNAAERCWTVVIKTIYLVSRGHTDTCMLGGQLKKRSNWERRNKLYAKVNVDGLEQYSRLRGSDNG